MNTKEMAKLLKMQAAKSTMIRMLNDVVLVPEGMQINIDSIEVDTDDKMVSFQYYFTDIPTYDEEEHG